MYTNLVHFTQFAGVAMSKMLDMDQCIHIAGWYEMDNLSSTTESLSKSQYPMLNYIVDEWISWHLITRAYNILTRFVLILIFIQILHLSWFILSVTSLETETYNTPAQVGHLILWHFITIDLSSLIMYLSILY